MPNTTDYKIINSGLRARDTTRVDYTIIIIMLLSNILFNIL